MMDLGKAVTPLLLDYNLHVKNQVPMKTPSERDVKRLFALSQNRCAYPGCKTAIVQASGTQTGKICHISAKSQGGPRYDPKQGEEQRNGFENLILLCSVHHDIVDQEPNKYTADLLRDFKEMHERNGNVELSQNDVRMAQKLLESYMRIEASSGAQVMVDSPGSIQAKTVNIKTSQKNPPIPLPTEAIGNNIEMRAYVDYRSNATLIGVWLPSIVAKINGGFTLP